MFFVRGCFLSPGTAGHSRFALSPHDFNVFQKKRQEALPMEFGFILPFPYVFRNY